MTQESGVESGEQLPDFGEVRHRMEIGSRAWPIELLQIGQRSHLRHQVQRLRAA